MLDVLETAGAIRYKSWLPRRCQSLDITVCSHMRIHTQVSAAERILSTAIAQQKDKELIQGQYRKSTVCTCVQSGVGRSLCWQVRW